MYLLPATNLLANRQRDVTATDHAVENVHDVNPCGGCDGNPSTRAGDASQTHCDGTSNSQHTVGESAPQSPPDDDRERRPRKRKMNQSSFGAGLAMSSYNSAFLCGIFEDIAAASAESATITSDPSSSTMDETPQSPRSTRTVFLVDDVGSPRPTKRSGSLRSAKSFLKLSERLGDAAEEKSLADIENPLQSRVDNSETTRSAPQVNVRTATPDPITDFVPAPTPQDASPVTVPKPSPNVNLNNICRRTSLAFQLDCIGSTSVTNNSVNSIVRNFPTLPATVSEASCSSSNLRARRISLQPRNPCASTDNRGETCKLEQGSVCCDDCVSTVAAELPLDSCDDDTSPRDGYGWFVKMDDDEDDDKQRAVDLVDPCLHKSSSDLAFRAPTAPKRPSVLDAEVEWAQAADTIDDVLGDFF